MTPIETAPGPPIDPKRKALFGDCTIQAPPDLVWTSISAVKALFAGLVLPVSLTAIGQDRYRISLLGPSYLPDPQLAPACWQVRSSPPVLIPLRLMKVPRGYEHFNDHVRHLTDQANAQHAGWLTLHAVELRCPIIDDLGNGLIALTLQEHENQFRVEALNAGVARQPEER